MKRFGVVPLLFLAILASLASAASAEDAASPAKAGMRKILLTLPVEAFDNATDGISDQGKAKLAKEGAGDVYSIVKEGPDYLSIGYSEGNNVNMLRFPALDGGAVVAVATQNERASTLDLWRIPPDGSAPALLPLEQAVARPDDGSPSPCPDPESPNVDFLSYSLDPAKVRLEIHWERLADGEAPHPWPDEENMQTLSLAWDGKAFRPAD